MAQFETVDIHTLIPDPENARLHPEANVRALRASIAKFGQPEPLVVRRGSNIVISGNERLQVMKDLGLDKVAVSFVDFDDAYARAYALVANRSTELGKWDFERLAAAAEELCNAEFSMESLGFDESFMAPVLAAEWSPETIDDEKFGEHSLDAKHGKPVQLTPEQRTLFDQACARLRSRNNEDYSEGRCLELMAADYLAGPDAR